MALTPSTMLALGAKIPDFELLDVVSGRVFSSDDLSPNKLTLVMFICNHCPFVIHLHEGISRFADDYGDKALHIIAVSSNDVEHYPQDDPEAMKDLAQNLGWTFPYLYDESQQVAKAFKAACTPDFYLFDQQRKLAYRGQFDGSRPGNNVSVSGADLRTAVDSLLKGEPAQENQLPSLGCNIKWKPGNEPDYFG